MFKCEVMGCMSKPGEKMHKIVVQKAAKDYYQMIRDEETRRMVRVHVGSGFEIVKEISATEAGVALFNQKFPQGAAIVQRPLNKDNQ